MSDFATPGQQFLPAYTMATVHMSLVHFPSWIQPNRQEQIFAEQERVQQHTAEQIVHVPVCHIQEQIVESIQVTSRELFPEQFVEQIVDIPVPPKVEERAEVMSSSHAAAYTAPTPVNEYTASSLADTCAAPAPVIECV